MPNFNYTRGRRKEYSICQKLREEGFDIVQRTAGSHSPVDIIAIKDLTKEILLVQSKPENFSSKKYDKYKWLNGYFKVQFEIR